MRKRFAIVFQPPMSWLCKLQSKACEFPQKERAKKRQEFKEHERRTDFCARRLTFLRHLGVGHATVLRFSEARQTR